MIIPQDFYELLYNLKGDRIIKVGKDFGLGDLSTNGFAICKDLSLAPYGMVIKAKYYSFNDIEKNIFEHMDELRETLNIVRESKSIQIKNIYKPVGLFSFFLDEDKLNVGDCIVSSNSLKVEYMVVNKNEKVGMDKTEYEYEVVPVLSRYKYYMTIGKYYIR